MRIKEVHLLSGNLNGVKDFYNGLLQLPVLEHTAEKISFSCGATRLHFYATEGKQPVYHMAFNIPANKIAEALEWVSARTKIIVLDTGQQMADFSNWQAESFYFYDRCGNILELIARHELRNPTAKPFDGNALLCVSEIGIVTDDVMATCQAINARYGLNFFEKQPPTKNFAALGDDHGLFIVVTKGRPWYATRTPATKHWLKVVFQTSETSDLNDFTAASDDEVLTD